MCFLTHSPRVKEALKLPTGIGIIGNILGDKS